MSKKFLSPIKDIIRDAKRGKMFILIDDKDRENEGDLIIPGSKCNSKIINFMAKHGRGLICLALSKKQVERLNLSLMSQNNKSRMQTAFTVSIEAKKGISTGISAFDRAKTIKVAINKKTKKNDIVSPGHVFPLVSREGGVLERAGHTEASVDISRLSNLNPSAVICEVMNEDGRMARLNDLKKFSKKHHLKITSIENLISYRLKYEKLIQKISTKSVKIGNLWNFTQFRFENKINKNLSFAITKGKLSFSNIMRVRVIAIDIKNNKINFNKKIIKDTIKLMNKFSKFALIIINNYNEIKGDNNKILKNNILRYYGFGAQIIKELKIRNMILMTRSKKKIIGLDGFGIKISKQEIIKWKKF